jgi:threonine/homoserine/homoserine lactone efflux protein
MFDPATFLIFIAACLVLLVVPGPAVLYITARSIDQGRMAGVVSVLGVHLGTTVHVLAAAIGVSALLLASATAFTIVKFAGAAYLVWLGLKRIFGSDAGETQKLKRESQARIFWEGFVVNVLNPKTALFFLAFLPQFIDPARGAVALQITVLGFVFIVLGIITDGAYALLAGTAARWIKSRGRFRDIQKYVTGGIFIALGFGAALAGNSRK